jgi:rubrerythrin
MTIDPHIDRVHRLERSLVALERAERPLRRQFASQAFQRSLPWDAAYALAQGLDRITVAKSHIEHARRSELNLIDEIQAEQTADYECEDCGIVRNISELTSGCPKCGQTMTPHVTNATQGVAARLKLLTEG